MALSTSNLAVQMFTIRDFLKTDQGLAESLEKASAMGYKGVQMSAVAAMGGDSPEVSATRARQLLDDNGLTCVATHRSWDDLVHKTEQEIEFHQILGCDYAAIGGRPGGYSEGGAGWIEWANEAQAIIGKLKAAGIKFGYHNHAHEFERVVRGATGGPTTFFDLLVNNGGPDLLFEIDVYWIDHSGANARKWIETLNGKVPVVHIKDKEMDASKPIMAPIGEGNLDWDELLPALDKSGTQWIAVEQDECFRDPFDCLKSSFEFLKNHPALNA